MKKPIVTEQTTVSEIGGLVCSSLKSAGIDCFLSGGAVVTIYTQNKYMSYDLDFVSLGDRNKIKTVMEAIGFIKVPTRHFVHPESKFYVEFPGSAVLIGDQPIIEFDEIKTKFGTLKLLTPTDSIKDRLAAFYHWNDKQGLEQAVMIARSHPVKLDEIKSWSLKEFQKVKFDEFITALKQK